MTVIGANLSALYSQSALKTGARLTATAMEHLSTGVQVNSPKDDASSFAIGHLMTNQIHGLNQAVRNINDGINLVQTAEGALVEVSNMLQRMRELAVQSANGALGAVQRDYLLKEVNALKGQIDQTANTTTWEDQNLLDGSFKNSMQIGTHEGETIDIIIPRISSASLLPPTSGTTESADIQFPSLEIGQSVTVDGLTFTAKRATTDIEVAAAFANLNSGDSSGAGAAYGRYQGTLGSFNSASSSGNQLVMTSGTLLQDVPDITLGISGVDQNVPPSVRVTRNPIPTPPGVTETSSIQFKALAARQSVTVAGLQFTANSTLSSAEVASAFANLQSGASTGSGTLFGSYSGTLTGYSSGATTSDAVVMTSTSPQVNVSNIGTQVNDRVESVPQIYKAVLSTPPNPSPLVNQTNNYIEYTDLGTSGETISLTKVSSPNVANDAISIVGTTVYRGKGNTAEAIGAVDSQLDGTAGKALRINLQPQFQNGSFDNGTAGSPSITGWTAINQRVKLDGTSMVAGWPTPIDTTTAPDGGKETTGGTGTFSTLLSSKSGSDLSVELNSNLGGVVNTPAGKGGVLHGPVLVSNESVRMNQGDSITFDWKAQGGSDAFDVYAYILNTESGQTEQILNATGATAATQQPWNTVSHTVANPGNYKFVFVSGSWDATKGTAAGAKLYIDNVTANSSVLPILTSTQVSGLTGLVKYQNTTPVTASITINGLTATSGPSASVDESATNLEAAIASLVSSGAIHDIAVTRIGNEISLTSTSPGATFAASSAGTSNDSLINMGFSQTQAPILGIDAPELPVVTTTDGIGGGEGVTQVSTITFPAMKIGQSVSIAGLTFTATSELTGDQVAEAFANISDSGTTGSQQALGVYSGTLAGFGSGTPIGNQLPFTCSQINDDAVDIPISVNDPIEPPITPFVQITQGQTNPSTIADFDAALDQVLIARSTLGGYINHLAYAGDNVTNTSSNTTQSRSIMVDTDYAIETADLIKHQIRQQAAMAMLAQANALPQTVLSLLRG